MDIAATLLNREPLSFTPELSIALSDYLSGLTVLITGAGGTIGSALVRVLSGLPCHIVAYDRSETNLTRLIAESHGPDWKARLTPFLGDINQPRLLDLAFRTHLPGLVIHAAAYKHLPLLESFPLQAVENNVLGTHNVLSSAIRHNTPKFVLVSTDKSVNPSSVMGATKRLAELVTLNPYGLAGALTRSIVVRLGNVLGSSGSVLPLFETQIAAGGPITVTSPDATRFFMSIPEAASLILTSAAIGTGGETFVLDMGEPVNITKMAFRLAKFRGVEGMEIKFTGMRPGEKLTEQLFTGPTSPTAHPRIWKVENKALWDVVNPGLRNLRYHVDHCDVETLLIAMHRLVPEYSKSENVTEANPRA